MKRYESIAKVFGEAELVLLEDALRKYEQDNLTEKGEDLFDKLRADIIMARRWAHQFGKVQR